jgi:hypothetical protein
MPNMASINSELSEITNESPVELLISCLMLPLRFRLSLFLNDFSGMQELTFESSNHAYLFQSIFLMFLSSQS